MKKFSSLFFIFIFLLCALPLAACNKNNIKLDFISDELHCVVSLPQEYDIFYSNDETYGTSMFNKDLYNAKTINGNIKKEKYNYYYVLKNEPFRILTPLNIIQNKKQNGQTLCYWKLNNQLYNSTDQYESSNIFTCAQDTEITPLYYDFRPVGMLLLPADADGNPIFADDEIIKNGEILDYNENVYFLYGVYDFEPYQQFWRTNLTINKWVINLIANNDGKYENQYYKINIEISSNNLFNNGKLVVKRLYKIEGHGYMIYGSSQIIDSNHINTVTHTFSIGKHDLKYIFA